MEGRGGCRWRYDERELHQAFMMGSRQKALTSGCCVTWLEARGMLNRGAKALTNAQHGPGDVHGRSGLWRLGVVSRASERAGVMIIDSVR